MNYMHLLWHQKEKEKKENMIRKNQISAINRQLSNIIEKISRVIDKEKYILEEKEANKSLVSSSIWRVSYLNNLESENVAVAQGVFIQQILKNEQIKEKKYFLNEVDYLMRQLGNLNWQLYQAYKKHSVN